MFCMKFLFKSCYEPVQAMITQIWKATNPGPKQDENAKHKKLYKSFREKKWKVP